MFSVNKAGEVQASRHGPRPVSSTTEGSRPPLKRVSWCDWSFDAKLDVMEEDIKLAGLPHCRDESSILAAHCDQVQGEEFEVSSCETLPHDTSATEWSVSQSLPPPQQECDEPSDPLVELGFGLGRAGNGKSLLDWSI